MVYPAHAKAKVKVDGTYGNTSMTRLCISSKNNSAIFRIQNDKNDKIF